jgi:GntR family transcriptional regulator / MocR family aminotransferase
LQGLDPGGNVIFAGSFSKLLFPALRMSFLVVPAALVDPLRRARSVLDRYPRLLEQVALADFVSEGHFGRHLRQMRTVYRERLHALQTTAERHWGEALQLVATETGLQTVAWLGPHRAAGPGWTDRRLAAAAAQRSIEIVALSRYADRWNNVTGLQIGFGAIAPAELRRAAVVLGQVLRQSP